ncbi:unnamed protein product [Vitrella brassicaformis CCMP3155]|uniref:Uncharacterized protein n=1 Tax=Vitrella brassicaformis (strain CCMP3155) TaxID=1169540 RepID=A0A0G4F888_VITBC|nr:unnamed protein product [Vitrella brassicaformis CCMP3155]|eukprot:CEM08936.1 unnamed protein product [Vitrella brassicaformis CCMP3155]
MSCLLSLQARRRLSRDELANVFGHLHPWELTPLWRRLGTPIFHESAANYTHLVIDCEDDTKRRMWEAMTLAVAHKWGKRATSIREIKHRYPTRWKGLWGGWCRGTWVALVEGHGRGRAAIAEKKRRERDAGEGIAAAPRQDDDGDRSADKGTLEMLSFEEVESFEEVGLDDNIYMTYPPPSSALPRAPTAPVHLPALKTIRSRDDECLTARVDRQWHTPAVKTLITRDSWLASWVKGGRAWVRDCEAIEVLDLNGRYADHAARVLSGAPTDGKSLAALRTLRGVGMYWNRPADIDRLREVKVARGVRQSIRELEIEMGWMPSTDASVECSQRVAQLIDAIARHEAVEKGVFALNNDSTCGTIDAELLSRSSTGPAAVQQIINQFAKRALTVVSGGEDEAVRATITDDTFPAAHTLLLIGDALDDEAKKKRTVEIASNTPSLSCVKAGDKEHGVELLGPAGEVWVFLERLQAALVSRGRERSLTLCLDLVANELTAPVHSKSSPCLWGRDSNDKLPPVEEVTMTVSVGFVDDDQFETFYSNVIATITSFNDELKGHKKTYVELLSGNLRTDFQQRFMAQQAGLSLLSGGPYKVSLDANGLCVERRNAAT